MKRILALATIGSFLFAAVGEAAEYRCRAETGERASLTVRPEGRELFWSDHHRASGSRGVFTHFETAPYAETKGYALFGLVDYHGTGDSGFVLALDPGYRRGGAALSVVEYFDNDDHAEDVTRFACERVR